MAHILDEPHQFTPDDRPGMPLHPPFCTCGRMKRSTLHDCKVCREAEWPEDERGPVIRVCTVCGEGACEWHSKEYKDGYQHEVCHESHDFTRAEEGRY
jgi:hypothetical protein